MTVVALIAFGWAWALANITVVALVRAGRFWRQAQRPTEPLEAQRVLLMRPCAGAEPNLLSNLTSVLSSRRSFDLEVCLGVESSADTAMPDIERACQVLRAARIGCRVAVNAPRGSNRKASQLAAIVDEPGSDWRRAGDDPLMISADSDVDLTDVDLDVLIAPLRAKQVAACWAPFVENATPRTMGDRASAALLRGSLHGFVLLAGLDRRGLVGKLFACRLDAVRRSGGFGGLTEQLGEDMELARRLRQAGYETLACPALARSTATGRSFCAAMSRYARWLTVIRAQRPWLLPTYPFVFLGPWLLMVSAALLASHAPILGGATAALALVSRWATAHLGRRLCGERACLWCSLVDALAADVLLALAFARACLTRRVRWRGHRFIVDKSGLLKAR